MLEDCNRCGACCFSESPRHARVTGDDYERLGVDAVRLVAFLGNQAFMRIDHADEASPVGRCGALLLDREAGTYLCSVYERRPEVCRALERASSACSGERATKGGRPEQALTTLHRKRIVTPLA